MAQDFAKLRMNIHVDTACLIAFPSRTESDARTAELARGIWENSIGIGIAVITRGTRETNRYSSSIRPRSGSIFFSFVDVSEL